MPINENLNKELLVAKYEAEINSIKLEHLKQISVLKEENSELKSLNFKLDLQLRLLEDHYEYFASWVETSECQLVRDTFFRNRYSLPLPKIEDVYAQGDKHLISTAL